MVLRLLESNQSLGGISIYIQLLHGSEVLLIYAPAHGTYCPLHSTPPPLR